jgi:hypothetical protein
MHSHPAVLDPVLGKSTVKRGKAVIMKIGDAEVEVDPKFRLYLQVGAAANIPASRQAQAMQRPCRCICMIWSQAASYTTVQEC